MAKPYAKAVFGQRKLGFEQGYEAGVKESEQELGRFICAILAKYGLDEVSWDDTEINALSAGRQVLHNFDAAKGRHTYRLASMDEDAA